MKFLLDANVPRSMLNIIEAHGHEAWHVSDIGLGDETDQRIAAQADFLGAVTITRDLDFADIRTYPPEPTPGFLVLRVPDDWTATRIVALMGRFLGMTDLVTQIPGHLVILDPQQVRFRPALS